VPTADAPHEARLLKLDCTRACEQLGWYPVWNSQETFEKTAGWYREFYENGTLMTESDLTGFLKKMNGGD